MVEFLTRDANRKLQLEAALALTNIARRGSETVIKVFVEHGAIIHFRRLLSYGDSEVVEQAVWVLGSIAGTDFRDQVLNAGVVGPLISLSEETNSH